MPRFQVSDPRNGSVLVMEGDSAPEEQEIEAAFRDVAHELVGFKEGPVTATIKEPRMPATGEASTTYGGGRKPLASYAETMESLQESDTPVTRFVAPRPTITEPRVSLPKMPIAEDASFLAAAGAEAINALEGVPEFFTSDLGIASMLAGKLSPRLVAAGFSADLTTSAFQQAKQAYQNWGTMTPADKGKATVDVLASMLFGGLTGAHAAGVKIKLPERAKPWQGPLPQGSILEPLKGAVPSPETQAIEAVRTGSPEIDIEGRPTALTPAEIKAAQDTFAQLASVAPLTAKAVKATVLPDPVKPVAVEAVKPVEAQAPEAEVAPPVAPEPKPAPVAEPAPPAVSVPSLVDMPSVQVADSQVVLRPGLMQYKASDQATGASPEHKTTITGGWSDIKAENLLLWEPNNPSAHGLTGDQKYIVADGHGRVNFGRGQGVRGYNAVVLRERDGYSVNDARIEAALKNIATGKGTIYDNAKFLRNFAATYGQDAALARARQEGIRGGQTASIAFDAADDLWTAFVNERITSDQAKAIAASAPNLPEGQRLGIKLALEGRPADDIAGILAQQKNRAGKVMSGEAQGTLWGDNDALIKEWDATWKKAKAEISSAQSAIRAIKGAGKNPEQAAIHGVNVADPQAVLQKVAELEQRIADLRKNPELVNAQAAKPQSPKIAAGVEQTDMLDATQKDTLSLVGEVTGDAARIKAEAEAKAKLAAEAKALEAKQQQDLFNPPTPAPPPKPTETGEPFPPEQSMGGALPSEFERDFRTGTGIKKAEIEKARQARGTEPADIEAGKTKQEEVRLRVMEQLDQDPSWPDRLVNDLTNNPERSKNLSPEEVIVLDTRYIELQDEYRKANKEGAQAQEDGRFDAVAEADRKADHWEQKLNEFEVMARATGTAWGRTGAMMQRTMKADFSFEAMARAERKIKGRALTKDEADVIRKQADEHKIKSDAYEKRIAELQGELDAKEVAAALQKEKADAKSEHPPIVIQIAEQIVASWDKRADAARSRIRERMSRMSAGVDPALILDLAQIGLSHAGHAALDLAKFGDKLTGEFGDWVKPHINDAWKKLQELIGHEKVISKPGTPRAKAVDKLINAPVDEVSNLTAKIAKRLKKSGEGDISWHVRKLARALVESGVKDLNDLVDKLHSQLQTIMPDMTRREAMDAMSGYGRFKPLTKDSVSVILRDLSGQAQQIAKLEDMAKGIAPSKTGIERRTATDAERLLLKQVAEAKKRGGYTVTDPESQLRSAMQTVHTRLQNQITDLEIQIAKREKIIKNPTKIAYDQKANELKSRRDELLEQFNEIFPKTPITEAERLAKWKQRVIERTTELKQRLSVGDFSKRQSKPPVQLDSEALRLRFDMHTIERQILEGRAAESRAKESNAKKALRAAGEIINSFRAFKTSFDLSAYLRQGGLTVLGHPIRSLRTLLPGVKAFGSEKAHFAVSESIRSRDNAPLYEQSGLYLAEHGGRLSQMEEVYMSRWAEKIPGIRGSGRSYTTILNLLRADSFDALVASLGKGGTVSLPQAKVLANYVNVVTGRGSKSLDRMGTEMNTAFFAPRWVISRLQYLAGQPLWGGGPWKGTGSVRALIAKEYARTLIGAGVVYALANAAGLGIETDPHSGNFLKIKVGTTYVDPLSGLIQWMTFLTRMATGRTVNKSGQQVPIRDRYLLFPYQKTAKVPFGKTDAPDVITRFVRGKLSPAFGETVNFFAGEDLGYQPMTLMSLPSRFLEPMNIADIRKAIVAEGIPTGSALALTSTLGMSMQTHERSSSKVPTISFPK